MKKLLLILTLVAGVSHHSASISPTNELPTGYYMVVAAYSASAENYAIKYVEALKQKGIHANYGFSKSKNMFFVYSEKYETRAKAIKSINSERERTGQDRAWVYVYTSGIELGNSLEKEPTQPETEEREIVKEDPEVVEEPVAPPALIEPTDKVEETIVEIPISHQGITYLFIEATDATTGKPINIDYEVIDISRNKLIATATSQESFPLKEPASASKLIQVQSNDIAWQKQSFDFKYYEPIIDPMSIFLDNLGDTTFVRFEMNPIKKGDIVTLYKVFFFKDAGIIMSKSIYELDQVVALMQNNPDLNILIHGHTNGKSAGKIIALKDDQDMDFFNINGEHRELAGSAVELSAERANVVARYLISKGIDDSRVDIKGWGGKKMLYDKHSKEARFNVRVEIEVIDK